MGSGTLCREHCQVSQLAQRLSSASLILFLGWHEHVFSPVNTLDPVWKHFGYGQLWPLWPACCQNWARLCMPDLTSHTWFSSVLPEKAWIILCKTSSDPMWMTRSGFGWTDLVQKQAGVQESLGLVLAEHNQPASQYFQTRLHSSTEAWII